MTVHMILLMINVALDIDSSKQSNTPTMAEKSNFTQLKARKSYFNVEIEYMLGSNEKLLHCNLHSFLSQNLCHRAQI